MSNSTPELPHAAELDSPSGAVRQESFANRSDLRDFVLRCAERRLAVIPGSAPNALPPESAPVNSFVSLSGLNRVLEHSVPDLVISVETGITIGRLSELLQNSNQWFPVPSAFNDCSLMDLINEGDAGTLEHRFGGLRELILGVDVLLASGEFVKCGGKVVKNVTGYDLTKLFVGAGGSLGIPVAAHLRLYALPEESRTYCYRFSELEQAHKTCTRLLRAGLPLSCVEICDARMLYDSTSATIYVCVQTHGTSDLLDELAGAAASIIGGAGELHQGDSELQLWQRLNNVRSVRPIVVQATNTLLIRLIEALSGGEAQLPPWSLRPGANKLNLYFAVDYSVDRLLVDIRNLCLRSAAIAEVSCGDRSMLRRVHRLPQEDSARSRTASQIKQAYDPLGIFNPLVTSL